MQAKAVINKSVVSQQSSEIRNAGVPPSQRNGPLRHSHRFGGECRSDALRRFSLQARTQQLSFNEQSIQKLRVSR
jgi:hypothetical protein